MVTKDGDGYRHRVGHRILQSSIFGRDGYGPDSTPRYFTVHSLLNVTP